MPDAMWILLAATAVLSASAYCQIATPSPLPAMEACQQVARSDALLRVKTINATAQLFRSRVTSIQEYLRRWAERVDAGAGNGGDGEGGLKQCLASFDEGAKRYEDGLRDYLEEKTESAQRWYDDSMYRILAEDISVSLQDKIVQDVKFHLESAQKEFSNLASSQLKDGLKNVKVLYGKAAFCIRSISIKNAS